MTVSFQNTLHRRANGSFALLVQKRAVRRLLVVALVASLALAAVSMSVIPYHPWRLPVVAIPFWGLAWLLNLSIRAIFELDDNLLDEYQLGLRNAAYKRAHGITLIFLLLVAVATGGLDLDRVQVFSVGMFAFLVAIMAPRLLVAWTMEDDAPANDSDD